MRAIQCACLGMLPILLLACGGAQPSAAEPPDVTSAGAEDAADAPEVEDEPQGAESDEPAAPAPTGPALVNLSATVKGEPVAATVRILSRGSDEVVAEGPAGEPLRVEAGEYELEIQVTDGKALVDKPSQRRGLSLAPGDDVAEAVEFPWARVQLNVRVNGTLDRGAVVRVMRGGQVVAELKSGADHVGISPGRYQAQVKTRGAVIDVAELMFPAGATQGVPVNVQM